MFLSLLVLYRNAALKKYVAVTELSPGRLFHLLDVPIGRSWAPKRRHSVAYISDYSSQRELITITKSQKWRTFLLDDSDRLRSPYLQRCTTHSSVNFIFIFLTKKAVSILARGKRQRTRTTYSSSGTQLYTIKSLLLPFQAKEKALQGALWARFGYLPAASILSPAFRGSTGILNSGLNGLNVQKIAY